MGGYTVRPQNQYLMISGWVSDNKKAWLPKSLLNLIGEGSWCEPASHRSSTSVVSKLQDGSLHIQTCVCVCV